MARQVAWMKSASRLEKICKKIAIPLFHNVWLIRTVPSVVLGPHRTSRVSASVCLIEEIFLACIVVTPSSDC